VNHTINSDGLNISSISDKGKLKRQDRVRVEPASDKAKPKERGSVRSGANFSQGKAKRARWCPKWSQLQPKQSQKSEVVSEVELTSAKANPKERGSVRNRTNFRQGRAKRTRWCPKWSQLQTRQSQKREVVSEVTKSVIIHC